MNLRLTFLGAARNVTGSRYLVDLDGHRVLVDCGLYQERKLRYRNWEIFPVPPKSIDAILLTHAHLDHVGYIPRLVKDGFRGRIHCTPATSEIARIVLLDSGHIQEEDAKWKQKRHKREKRSGPYPVQPLYTQADADKCSALFDTVEFERPLSLPGGMTATFNVAGHILGSSMITLDVAKNGQSRRLLFSGDVGRWEKPILRDPTLFEQADYVQVESTYGNRVHEDVVSVEDRFAEEIDRVLQSGGNLIIPSFSVERAHEIMYALNNLVISGRIPILPVFIDSPMAIRVTQVFKDHPELWDEEMQAVTASGSSPFAFPGLKMTRTADESKAINQVRGSAVIIAGSGMCTGGRIKHHLKHNIDRPESTVLFTGYQASGTLGRIIVDGASNVRILGRHYEVRSRISQVHGFSGHADRNELMRWIGALKTDPKGIFVTHGEQNAATQFADLLRQKFACPVTVPDYGEEAILE